MDNIFSTHGLIIALVVDTKGKTNSQLECEVTQKVDKLIADELDSYNGISSDEYEEINKKLKAERNGILEQFIFQIRNRDEIFRRFNEVAFE